MKVCGKKDIHVPGCSDCQELEERVEAVEECCDDAHGEIDTLNTDKADKDYVDDSIETVNQTIVDVADTLGERIDNIITASEPSVITLWEGVMDSIGNSANLSEDVNDFDYLDIYYRTSVDESEGYYNTVRIPADQFANYTITVGGTMSPLAESPILKQYLTQVSFVDDTATIDNIREWSWNGSQSSDAADDPQAETGVTIYRIDGVKEVGGNLEIADAREGVDGTVYPSLGDAIRGQIQDTRDMIPQLVKTVQGNPIVLDDAFGDVKNLTVELLPIQEGSGTPSPSNVRPISGHNSVDVLDTGINQFDKSTALDGYINDTNGVFMPSTTRKATDFIPVFGGESYLIKTSQTESEWGAWYDANKNFIIKCIGYEGDTVKTAPSNARYLRLTCVGASSGNIDTFAVNYPSTDTAYHAYHGQSKTVTLPHTVYGAGVGVTSGEGKETWANIPSYNGETISEPWLSSMDEYVQGATPTTGAQVTYKLATPTDLSTTPTDITLYNGDNVISSDGDMELSYVQDMAAVIRKIENQL